jgi:hypothetical protein
MVISDKKRYIFYISDLYEGRLNDMGVFKSEFEPGKKWFADMKVIVDLGFVGIAKHYEIGELLIGHKRKRSKKGEPKIELTEIQKQHNKKVSSERIYVEHAIGEMKRYRVLINRCRIKCYERKNREVGVCAGLANYKLLLRA